MDGGDMSLKKAAVIMLSMFLVLVIFSSIVTVPAGHRGVLLTWGKVEDVVLSEGLHFKTPIAQKVVKISVRTQKYYIDNMDAATKDMQDLYVEFSANYHLNPVAVNKIYKELGKGYADIVIAPAIQQIVKQNTVKFEAENTMANREILRQNIEIDLRIRLEEYDMVLEYIHIENLDFNEEFRAAIERKATAAQNLLAEQRELEITKIKAQQKIEEAVGDAEALLLDAEAKAKAMNLQKQQITQQLSDYKAIEKWDGVLPQYTCGITPFVDIGQLQK